MDQRGALVGMVEMNAQYLPDHSSPLSQAGDVRPAMTNHVYEERSWKLKELSAALGVHLHTIIWRKGNHVVAANYPYPPRICLFISIANWKLGGGTIGGTWRRQKAGEKPTFAGRHRPGPCLAQLFFGQLFDEPMCHFPKSIPLSSLLLFMCPFIFEKGMFFSSSSCNPP